MLRTLDRRLKLASRLFICAIGVIMFTLIELVDVRSMDLNLIPMHWVPIAFATWYGGLELGLGATAIAALMSVFNHLFAWPFPLDHWRVVVDGAVRALSFGVLVLIIDFFRSTFRREEMIRREATQTAETLRSEALFVMSREINNTATALATAIGLAKARADGGGPSSWAPIDGLVASLQASSMRFIEQARLAPQRSTLPLQRVDLGETFTSVAELYRRPLHEADLEVAVALPEKPAVVWADAGALSLVLSHCLAEAARRAARGKKVTLSAERSDGLQPRVRVAVSTSAATDGASGAEKLRLVIDLLRLHNSFFDVDEADGVLTMSFTLVEASARAAA